MQDNQKKAKQNLPQNKNNVKKSLFPELSHRVAFTARFGEITPFFVMESVAGDKVPLRSKFDMRTYTLKSPMLDNLTMRKSFFQVPKQAILPLQFDRIYTQPTIGDDVPQDAYCTVNYRDFWSTFVNVYQSLVRWKNEKFATGMPTVAFVTAVTKFAVVVENVCSRGSLAKLLGYGFDRFSRIAWDSGLSQGDYTSPDEANSESYDALGGFVVGTNIFPAGMFVAVSDSSGEILRYDLNNVDRSIVQNCRALKEFISSYPNSYIGFEGGIESANQEQVRNYVLSLLEFYSGLFGEAESNTKFKMNLPCDLSNLLAYQLVCAQYFTSDFVDYIYSAELYRNYIASICYDSNKTIDTFPWNGTQQPYDYLSAHTLSRKMFLHSSLQPDDIQQFMTSWPTLMLAIFGFNRSLRYGDYFTGSRTRPLAVGDVDVKVNSGSVSVVDVTRNIQMQKFLNQVNRFGRKLSNYMEGVNDVNVAYDYHDPKWLAETSSSVYGSETDNTASEQFSQELAVTTTLHNNSNDYAFEIFVDRPSVLIGVVWFDIRRYYPNAILRTTLIRDRFDMFNPYFQFIGDQPIYKAELDPALGTPGVVDLEAQSAFGYTTRNQEYKVAFDRCCGGFYKSLPSWIFFSDAERFVGSTDTKLSPEYIRSFPAELDRFYQKLTGVSLEDYWHFIIVATNITKPVRPMVKKPQILG